MHAGGGGMNALPPTGLPAACVRGAGRRGQRPIGPCAGTVAKSVARPSAQDARRPRRPAFFTAAETRNGAARLRVTGAGGAIGHGRDARMCTRCGTHPPIEGGTVCEPCHAARRDREREQYAARRAAGLCGRCGTPAPSDAAYCDRCAGSAAKRSRKKAKNSRSRQRYVQRRVRRLCIDCGASSQGASRCPPCARRSWARSGEHRGLPVLPPRVTVIEIATGVNHGTWERWEDVVDVSGLRQAFTGPGGADPGYVEHRPVCRRGRPKARSHTPRALPRICAFAPCTAHSGRKPSKPPYWGNGSRRFGCFPTTLYMCARQHGPGMILPASRRGT